MSQNDDGPAPITCHFVSNTHWDREWRFSMQRTRHMLVQMMDMLLDIFDKEPRFASFHLDSQSIPIQDYLEIRPEKRDVLARLVREGRLLVGPWFVLPDEFCVGGESLVRNLLLGHRIARDLGAVSKTGYSPFSWGQISQMPQIYAGFGIPFAAFYRGINTLVAPKSEFRWKGADGTTITGSRLARRPRYNVWYVVQRPAYWGLADPDERVMRWSDGHAPFRMADVEFCELDMRHAHPRFEYHADLVPERARQALEEQDAEWTTPHRFWSNGHDSSGPDIREVRMIEDCNRALAGRAEVVHSTFAAFQEGVCASVGDDVPEIEGEMRYLYTEGSSSPLIGWVISARTDLKVRNFATERLLGRYAEPMAVFASLLGAAYPRGFIDTAWNWLLQNHGHDSIGCCSRDVVPADMVYRYRQADEIGACVMEQAFIDIAGAVDLSGREARDVAIVAFNPLSRSRDAIVELKLDLPRELASDDVEIVDESGQPVVLQRLERSSEIPIVQSPNDTPNVMEMERYHLYAELRDLPPMGYRTFFARPVTPVRRQLDASAGCRPDTIENEHFTVVVQGNGALDVTEKATGRRWRDVGYFRDRSEMGDPWRHKAVPRDRTYTSLGCSARISSACRGDLVSTLRVEIDLSLPRCRTADEVTRSEEHVTCRVVNLVTLRKGGRFVEIETTVDNVAEDHYLQVSFPTRVDATTVQARIPFDVVTREIAPPDPSLYIENVQTEHPMSGFVDITDGSRGVALLAEGLKAYESHDDDERTVSLTILRCFPLRIAVGVSEGTDYSRTDRGGQCLGRHTFRYAFMPHAGDWEAGDVWAANEALCHAPRVAQIGPSDGGHLPPRRSFLEVEPPCLHVSGIKQSEDGAGWVARLLNPTGGAVSGRIRLNGGRSGPGRTPGPIERQVEDLALPAEPGDAWERVRLVTLEEVDQSDLQLDAEGWVGVELGPRKIVTVKFS